MSISWLGGIGTALVIVAYLPQIIHLVDEHCSAGLSFRAYVLWGLAAILLLSYAISQRDMVFIALQSYQLVATVLICFFAHKYEDSLCEIHGGAPAA
jgi:uncharacterized protein with PQ loop repeat